MPVSSTRAGMRNYVPRRQGMSMDTVTGPEERAKRAMMIRQAKEDEMDKAAQTAQAMPPAMKKGGMVKKRRFADGGETEDTSPVSSSDSERVFPEADRFSGEEKPQSFKAAFAEARSAGDKTFEWQGKKYSTAVAGGSSTAPKASKSEKAYSDRSRAKDVPAKKYQSLAERSKGYESARASSGVGMYGGRKATSEPSESRRPLQIAKSDMQGPFTGMGTDYKPKMRGGETFAKGGSVGSASKRADGIASKGKTRGKMC